MAIGRKELMAKAKGFTLSIDTMKADHRVLNPKGEFGEDYNRLRAHTVKLYPDLEPLLPPPVRIEDGSAGYTFATMSFDELRTFAEQIYQLLADHEPERDER